MSPHARKPALLAIALTALAGIALFAATGQFRKPDLASASLEELEKRVPGSKNPREWLAYADKLTQSGRHASAAKALQQALALQPDLPDARLKLGLALGQSNKDAFFDYVTRLSMNYPKQALDLLKHPELAPLHADARWETTFTAAQAQAVD